MALKRVDKHRQGLKGLACATLGQALKDMRRDGSPRREDYISSVVWLGSMRATRFFDTAEISQEQALLAVEWSTHAKELCHRSNGELTLRQHRVLLESLDALNGKMPPKRANGRKTTS